MRAMAQRSWARGEPLVALELPTPAPKRDEVRVAVRVNTVERMPLEQAERAQQQSRTNRVTGKLVLIP